MNQSSCNTPTQSPVHHGVIVEVAPRGRTLTAVIERQGRRLLTQRRFAANPFFAICRDITVRWPNETTSVRRTTWPALQ